MCSNEKILRSSAYNTGGNPPIMPPVAESKKRHYCSVALFIGGLNDHVFRPPASLSPVRIVGYCIRHVYSVMLHVVHMFIGFVRMPRILIGGERPDQW